MEVCSFKKLFVKKKDRLEMNMVIQFLSLLKLQSPVQRPVLSFVVIQCSVYCTQKVQTTGCRDRIHPRISSSDGFSQA